MAVKTKQQLIDGFKAIFKNDGTAAGASGDGGRLRPTDFWVWLTDLVDTIFSFATVQDITDAKSRANHTGTQAVSSITGLATVATSGNYNDLTNKPTAVDISGKADKDISINTRTASYTLVLADKAGFIRMNLASANTLTVPPNSAEAFPVGTQIVLSQAGAGQTTVVAGSGVTVNSSGAKMKLSGQYSGATLIKVATDTWTLFGDLAT